MDDTSATGFETAIFGGTAGTVALGTSLSASNLQFTTPAYTLSGAGTLTLGGGINASALNSGTTTISTPLALPATQQLWQVGSGATLAVNSALTRSVGASVDFTTSGVTTTSSSLANDATGISVAGHTVNDTTAPLPIGPPTMAAAISLPTPAIPQFRLRPTPLKPEPERQLKTG